MCSFFIELYHQHLYIRFLGIAYQFAPFCFHLQVSQVTNWFDNSQVYGSTEEVAADLRLFQVDKLHQARVPNLARESFKSSTRIPKSRLFSVFLS